MFLKAGDSEADGHLEKRWLQKLLEIGSKFLGVFEL